MNYKRINLTFVFLTAIALGTVFSQQYNTAFEQRTFELINIERARHGLHPYVLNNTLSSIARSHSEDMLRNNFLGSTGSDGADSSQLIRRGGINNFSGPGTLVYAGGNTPEQRITNWMNSNSQRAIILHENRTSVGIGIVQRPSGSGATYSAYWTLYVVHIIELSAFEIQAFERRVLELTNIERARHGSPPVVWDDRLASVAREHSVDLMRNNMTGHTGSDGSIPRQRVERANITNMSYRGENCSYGHVTPEEAVNSWMNSPGHRDNLLNPSHTHLGVGLALRSEDSNSRYITYWTQVFGQSR